MSLPVSSKRHSAPSALGFSLRLACAKWGRLGVLGRHPSTLTRRASASKTDGRWRINSSFLRVRRSAAGARAPMHACLLCNCPQWEPPDKTPCLSFLPFPDSFPYSLPGISCDLFPNKLVALMFCFSRVSGTQPKADACTVEPFNETKPQRQVFPGVPQTSSLPGNLFVSLLEKDPRSPPSLCSCPELQSVR